MHKVLNTLLYDIAEIKNIYMDSNLDKVVEAIKHKNLMVPRALNTVKCVVKGVFLGKGHYTYHILRSFFLKHLLLTAVGGMALSLMDLWFKSMWPYSYINLYPLFCSFKPRR